MRAPRSLAPLLPHPAHSPHPARRHGRTLAAVVIYLVLFGLVVAAVSRFYLLPALNKAQVAAPEEKKRLAGQALLVMVVVLFVLLAGLVLTFRVGRFFFPRPPVQRRKTEYVDAWAESAKRMPTPPADEADEAEESGESGESSP